MYYDLESIFTSNSYSGTTDSYSWTQTLKVVEVSVPVKPGLKSKDIFVEIKSNKLVVALKKDYVKAKSKETSIVDGKLHASIKADEAMWTLVDNKRVDISLEKINDMSWWPCVIVGDAEIDTKRIVPENSKLSDLDGDTRQTVEKMMFDQRQKQMGKPTSDQQKQADLLQNFMKQHPEMDFSKCKVNYGDNAGGMGGFPGLGGGGMPGMPPQ